MHDYEEIKEKICRELMEYGSKDHYSMSDIEIMDKLANTVKNIDKIIMYEDGGSSEYAYDGRGNSENAYYGGRSGRSYTRDGRSERRGRDSMGRYTSRADRSYADESMIGKLSEMMNQARTPAEREAIKDCIAALEEA